MTATKDPSAAVKRATAENTRALGKILRENREREMTVKAANVARLAEATASYKPTVDEYEARLHQLRLKKAGLEMTVAIAEKLQALRDCLLSGRPIGSRNIELATHDHYSKLTATRAVLDGLKVVEAKKLIIDLLQPYIDAGDIPLVAVVFDNRNGRGGDRSYYIRTALVT